MNTKSIQKLLAIVLTASAGMVMSATLSAAPQDDQIERAFRQSQVYRTQLKDTDISIKSSDGVVTLKGVVQSENQKHLAEETARAITGVQQVTDELRVNDLESAPSDEKIALSVRGALLLHKNVSLAETDVSANGGVVTLTGNAKSEAEKELAGKYAADVKGVKRVVNNMQVVSSGQTSSADRPDGHATSE